MALALALLAVTFNFLQPLAHAAAMRGDLPGALWSTICQASAADPEREPGRHTGTPGSSPGAAAHDCCLGLAHAPLAPLPPLAVFVVPPPSTEAPPLQRIDLRAGHGIRDGPHQPRAPPLLLV
jgi:hypothetical protein